MRGQAGVLRNTETTERYYITEISSSHLYSNLIIKGTLDRNAIFVHYGHSINIRISLLKIKIVLIEKQLSISI